MADHNELVRVRGKGNKGVDRRNRNLLAMRGAYFSVANIILTCIIYLYNVK
jgi:hypothetical protein